MSKIMRFALLAMSLVSLFGVLSSAAGAVTWTNTGQTAFTATSGPLTLTSPTSGIASCGGGDASGATRTPVSGVGAAIAAGTIIFTNCRTAGLATGLHCDYTLTANAFAAGVASGNADLTCGLFVAGREICHIEGPTAFSYTNGAAGVLALPHSNTLVVTNGSGGGSCPLGSNDRVTLSPLTFRVTSGTGPTIATD
jgi:hypothetical protein